MPASRDAFVVLGMARSLWVTAYANEVEEQEREWNKPPPRATNGADLDDYAPQTPDRAFELAFYLLGSFEQLNKESIFVTLERVFKAAGIEKTDEQQQLFGHYLVQSALGAGVCWEDSHPEAGVQYPKHDCGELEAELWPEVTEYLEGLGIYDCKEQES